jgi:hypothetical protein
LEEAVVTGSWLLHGSRNEGSAHVAVPGEAKAGFKAFHKVRQDTPVVAARQR